jgi:hypothetical protein
MNGVSSVNKLVCVNKIGYWAGFNIHSPCQTVALSFRHGQRKKETSREFLLRRTQELFSFSLRLVRPPLQNMAKLLGSPPTFLRVPSPRLAQTQLQS